MLACVQIREKQAKVADRQVDLKEAQATGDTKKIAKEQRKVQEAEAELKEAQNELSSQRFSLMIKKGHSKSTDPNWSSQKCRLQIYNKCEIRKV